METGETKVLCKLTGKILLEREKNEDLQRTCRVENISEWTLEKKKRREECHGTAGVITLL